MTFEDLGLNPESAASLAANSITLPSQIQEEVFKPLREGESVIALSKTGTGKTLAYLAPLVQRYAFDLKESLSPNETWGLILVPTRELASQAEKNLKLLSGNNLQAVVIIGGESEKNQISLGSRSAVYIATPGRFLDLLSRKQIKANHLKCVVFDEADRILDMGFANDIRAIRQQLPKELQLCFFSATIHFGIDEIAYEFGVEALRIGKESDELTVEGLDHRVAFVGDNEKLHALVNFLKVRPQKRGIVFCNYKQDAYGLTRRLDSLGFVAESLTSDLSQSERTRTMQKFRDNKLQVLIASDLASRGLDVEDLDFVVNMDLPEDPATYLHRVGRTARAGKKGIALSLVGFRDAFQLERLEKYLGKSVERFEFDHSELAGPLHRANGSPQSEERAPQHERTPRAAAPRAHAPREHKPHTPQRAPNSNGTPSPQRRPENPRHQHSRQEQKVHNKPSVPQTTKQAVRNIPKDSIFKKIIRKTLKLFGLKLNSDIAQRHSPSKPHVKSGDRNHNRSAHNVKKRRHPNAHSRGQAPKRD